MRLLDGQSLKIWAPKKQSLNSGRWMNDQERLFCFAEVVKGLKEGKVFKRKHWNYIAIYASEKSFRAILDTDDNQNSNFSLNDFEATDWIEVK
jgi:hypothetical protein